MSAYAFIAPLPSLTPTRSRFPSHRSQHHLLHPIVVASSSNPSLASSPPVSVPAPSRPLLECPTCRAVLPDAPYPAVTNLPPSCPSCTAPLPRRRTHLDLTGEPPRGPVRTALAFLTTSPKQSTFQLPNVSFAYERGWRAGFARAGFPGPDAEADMALDFLLPAQRLLDMSCGSGLIARRLANNAPDTQVIAADYSAAMLSEAAERAKNDPRVPRIEFVRADVAALPFADGAFDGVHSGAALHCWPRLQDGLREIYRVIAPGGGLFATTFEKTAYFTNPMLREVAGQLDDLVGLTSSTFRFFRKDELRFLVRAAGFIDVDVSLIGNGCLIVKAMKPADTQL